MARLAIGAVLILTGAFVLLKLVDVPAAVPAKARGQDMTTRLSIDPAAMERIAPRHLPAEAHPIH